MNIKYLVLTEIRNSNAMFYGNPQPIEFTKDGLRISLDRLGEQGWLLCGVNDERWIFSQSQ